MQRYSVREAAECLGVSAALVYALCAGKKLRHERIGMGRGRIIIPEDAIAEFRQTRTVIPEQTSPEGPPQNRSYRHLR